jgi:type II secretory pathway predicted ATPase ExeA
LLPAGAAEFYGLTTQPFQLAPDVRFFFDSTVHRQAMAYLVYGLRHAEGFIIITGEVSAGKTILVNNRLSTIDRNSFVTANIVTTQLAGDDLLYMLAAGFGIAKEGLAKASPAKPEVRDEALSQITRRLDALEDSVQKHERVIKRAIEIAAIYLKGERP